MCSPFVVFYLLVNYKKKWTHTHTNRQRNTFFVIQKIIHQVTVHAFIMLQTQTSSLIFHFLICSLSQFHTHTNDLSSRKAILLKKWHQLQEAEVKNKNEQNNKQQKGKRKKERTQINKNRITIQTAEKKEKKNFIRSNFSKKIIYKEHTL